MLKHFFLKGMGTWHAKIYQTAYSLVLILLIYMIIYIYIDL